MDKSLPIIMVSNAGRTGRRIKSYKLIRHGVLIAPLLIGSTYAGGDPTYAFNLPAQPLSATMDSLAQSAHTKLIYSDATVKGLRAAPVKGKYTAQQALSIALGQSGLNYKVVDKTLITVTGKPAATEPASAITLKPMTVGWAKLPRIRMTLITQAITSLTPARLPKSIRQLWRHLFQ